LFIFITIFGVGFLLLIMSLIFGHDVEIEADVEVDAGISGPNIFSVKMISLLMVGFGSMSFGVRATTEASMFMASMAGIGGAVVVGAIGYFIIRAFYASQASSTVTDQDVIGVEARLIDSVAEGGYGQIACILRGREMTYMARSKDGKAINQSVPVRVIGKTGSTVTVEPIE
jgi:hypothetical protein